MYQKLQKYSIGNDVCFEEYKWLKNFCFPGEHKKIFDEFIKLHPKKDAKILILGAGTWAFDQRLLDHWLHNITSTDFLGDSYQVKGTKFSEYDLNKDNRNFSEDGFDYIFAIEVIEHLENQFHFLRNINKSLVDNWILLISTPNITNQFSKANFIVKWELAHFSKLDLEETGHIQVIAPHIFKYNYENNWFSLIKLTDEWKFRLKFVRKPMQAFLGYLIYSFLMLFLWGNKNQINIYIY